MKKKLPIIRAALEAGLTLTFTTRTMGELLDAVCLESPSPWRRIEERLPCLLHYDGNRFLLAGIEKKEGAES
jgi:hypothetical protein